MPGAPNSPSKVLRFSAMRNKSFPTPTIGVEDWYQDVLLSTLFRACIKLQTQMDRRFRKGRMTAQEAAVLVHCVESRQTSPGALAHAIGRDKGKVTRFIQRLVARGLLKREVKQQDRRVTLLRPTGCGRAIAPELKLIFAEIRERFFKGILAKDIERVARLLTIMLTNVERNGFRSGRKSSGRYARNPSGPIHRVTRTKEAKMNKSSFLKDRTKRNGDRLGNYARQRML
jgi:DNA-binding MarR family transcriptional regulator